MGSVLIIFAVILAIGLPNEQEVSKIIKYSNRRLKKMPLPYCDYQCRRVSWNDGTRCRGRSTTSIGPFMTDTRLRDKQNNVLYTVRPDNHMERLGQTSAEDISVVVGNDKIGSLRVISLKELLENIYGYAWYVNMTAGTNLLVPHLDDQISIRFQFTFLPVDHSPGSSVEFVPESYNYNTVVPSKPRNLIIVATSEGVSFYQDTVGYQKLYYQEADSLGRPHLHWYNVGKTDLPVGHSRAHSGPDARNIGIPAMGKRSNAMLTIQVPLKQSMTMSLNGKWSSAGMPNDDKHGFSRRVGQSNVAYLHKGSELGIWDEMLSVASVTRDPHERITATVVLFHTVTGGIPSTEDMKAAVDEMEFLLGSLKPMPSVSRRVPCSTLTWKKYEKRVKVVPVPLRTSIKPPTVRPDRVTWTRIGGLDIRPPGFVGPLPPGASPVSGQG